MEGPIGALRDLQSVDTELFLMHNLRKRRPEEFEREREKITAAESNVRQVQDAIKVLRMQADRGELEIRNKQAEVDKLQVQLNVARSNEEYSVLQDKIGKLRQEIDAIEEEVLERLTETESMQSELEDARKLVERADKEVQRKKEELDRFLEELDGRIGRLEGQRQETVKRVEPDALEIYGRVLARYPDSPLAPVDASVCQGCHMSITKQLQNRLMIGRELVQCPSCMRILYLED